MVFVAWMGGGGSCIASAPFRIGGKVHRLWDFRDTVYRRMTRCPRANCPLKAPSLSAIDHRRDGRRVHRLRSASASPMRLHRLLMLLALSAVARSAKVSGPRLWVKRPGNKKLVIVESLASLCAENELDEEAMMAVSRGELDDYKGWECGEMECEDDDEADDEATTEAEAGEVPPSPSP